VVQDHFADFTGAPFDDPRVEIHIQEGRNFLASRSDKYDVIKISVTDTWTASAMGAYALTENYLYTVEAIREFMNRLTPGGILSIVRWYPQESIRLAALAAVALDKEDAHLQMAMARSQETANLLLKNGAFSSQEIDRLARRTRDAGLVWIGGGAELAKSGETELAKSGETDSSPRELIDDLHRRATHQVHYDALVKRIPFSIVPPTDDRPFFFSPVTIGEAAQDKHDAFGGFTFQHGRGLKLLWGMLKIALAVAAVFVLGPLLLRGRKHLVGDLATNVYFLMLGFGFLLIEIPLLQSFILFLGDPIYAVTVVLFALLVSSGLGSLCAENMPPAGRRALFPLLLVLLVVLAGALPSLLGALIGLSIAVRVVVTVVLLTPLGLLLGMPFPIGVRELHRLGSDRVPWAWAINGAASVGAPVIAMIVAIESGFSTALYLGAGCYAVAGVMLVALSRQRGKLG
jgi:hypothetical protein